MEKPIRENLEGIDDPIGLSYEDLKDTIESLLSSNSLKEKKELTSEKTNRVVG